MRDNMWVNMIDSPAPSMNSKEKNLLSKLEKLNQEQEKIKQELKEVRTRKKFECGNCKKKHPISKLTLLEPYWYETPYGCTGGDSWHRSDEYKVFCPSCGIFTRVLAKSVSFENWNAGKAFKIQHDPNTMFGWIYQNKNKFKENLRYHGEKGERGETGFQLIEKLRKKEQERKERRFW